MPASDLRYVYLPFADVRKSTATTTDGIEVPTRIVSGVMTDETVDLDGEIVDYDSAKKAATDWFRDWANVREQHSSNAIGTGIAMVTDDVNKEIRTTIEVVDPLAIVKIDKGVLKGQSVGLKGARRIADADAPHGRLVGFSQVEDSLVDRPSNPTAKFAVTKSAKDGSLEIGKALQISEAQIRKIASADQNKLAAVDDSKGYTPDSHGHLHTHNAGTDQEYDHDHGHDHVGGLHADGKAADHQHDHYSKAIEPDETKGSIIPGQAAANSSGEGVAVDVTSPSGATAGACPDGSCTCGGCGPSCEGTCCDECTMNDDLDRRETLHFSANPTTSKKSTPEEATEDMYAKAVPQIKALLEAGDQKAALAVIAATELLVKGSIIPGQAGGRDTSDEVETQPQPAGGKKRRVKPEDGGAGQGDHAPESEDVAPTKFVVPDSMKAVLSEVTKAAVDAAVKPLKDQIAELEKRGIPGPVLRQTGAPRDVQAELAKANLGGLTLEQLKDYAENYPDGQIRMGFKQLLADVTKGA